MNRNIRLLTTCVALSVALCLAPPAGATDYVVDQKSPAASDDGPGTADKPFKTIAKAVSGVKAGDTVTIKAGVYREAFTVKASGTAERPIVIQGALGERVVVSGAEELKGWKKVTKEEARGNPNWEHIYVAEVAEPPDGLFQNGQAFLPSRWPSDGRVPAEGGGKDTVVDSKGLTQPAGQWEGGTLVVRVDKIGSYFRDPIIKYDPQKHELAVKARKPRAEDIVPVKDTYWIEAAVAAIDEPGEYALDARATPIKVYLWPQGEANPNDKPVETRRLGPFLVGWGPGAAFLTFRNLEIAYSEGSGIGADSKTAKDAHDIRIEGILGHHNGRAGCSLDGQRNVTVRRSLFCRNAYGILMKGVKDMTVEESYVLANDVDGLVVSWRSENVRIARCASVDHWWESHPDAFQMYNGIQDLTIDSCLFFNGGQGMMTSEANHIRIVNNMIVGTHIKAVILAGVVNNYEIVNNTIAFPGLQPISSSDPNLVLKNNVILPGGREQLSIRHKTPKVDYNLYWKPEGYKAVVPDGSDAHSKFAAPKFRCAPPGLESYMIRQWGAGAPEMDKCTPGKFYLGEKPVSDRFKAGDWVEVNYDGVPRKVTEATADYVAFEPPIKQLHPWWSDIIVNWRDRKDFAWDLRLEGGSPGKGMGSDGKDVGSNIDVQSYLKGDFDGDGRRDVPDLPENFDRRR